mmetsp:Transcript_27192/g.32999  ORF Transcript_27192/g.32999 Transcript_27192/m.32999 type:complete len:208 (-) Transcript_27192:223-846(-)
MFGFGGGGRPFDHCWSCSLLRFVEIGATICVLSLIPYSTFTLKFAAAGESELKCTGIPRLSIGTPFSDTNAGGASDGFAKCVGMPRPLFIRGASFLFISSLKDFGSASSCCKSRTESSANKGAMGGSRPACRINLLLWIVRYCLLLVCIEVRDSSDTRVDSPDPLSRCSTEGSMSCGSARLPSGPTGAMPSQASSSQPESRYPLEYA